jgi:aspartyl-tRNA(Asn)/glutamyl-tRNA(Gln) amidotransferase subunit B
MSDMNKEDTIIMLIISMECIDRHENFPKVLSNLIINDLFGLMGDDYDITRVEEEKPHMKVLVEELAHLLSHDQIKYRHVRQMLKAAWNLESWWEWDICWYIKDSEIFDEVEIGDIVEKVIAEQDKAWADYKSGKSNVMKRLVGCVMKETKGKADPEEATKLFENRRSEEV